MQATPAIPQVPFADVWHLPVASQHPFGHDVASHTQLVPLQRWPVTHGAHVRPDLPHAEAVSVVMQVVPLQQPVGHEVASHTHVPAGLHSCPVPHVLQAAPAIPQVPEAEVWH